MIFDSPIFVAFLLIVVLIYWRLSFKGQNLFLLGASFFFYGWWDWRFLMLMIGSACLDFVLARKIEQLEDPRSRRILLIVSLVVNFSLLGFFKYFNFFIDSFAQLLDSLHITGVPRTVLEVVLPPGISFYTFQEVAYIVDVYYRRLKAADSWVQYALFISLFPHLIAGPIQRPSHLLPQVQKPRTWDPEAGFDGLLLIMEGFFRKIVVADNCAIVANAAFGGKLGPPNLMVLLLGTYAFAWQIYGDFSAYSNIARGSAQLLGFHFVVNFRQPYFSQSLQEFWRRWHISLSSWLRDYLYVPLGGNRHGTAKTYRNLILTMLLGGLWHGANWTFVVWGAIHGFGLAIERLFGVKQSEGGVGVWIRRLLVFAVVCLAWVFFRAASISEAFTMLSGLGVWHWEARYLVMAQILAVFTVPLILLDLTLEKTGLEYAFQAKPYQFRVAWSAALFAIVVLFGASQNDAFIYFQF